MNMQQIKYFVTAGTCLNFSQAAELLYITQPTLSRQITKIENELNLQLFIRYNRSVRLTPAGKALYEELKKVDTHYEYALERAQEAQRGVTSLLRIGILDGTAVDELLPPVMSYFQQNQPYINISLAYHSFNALATKLYEGELDLALTLLFDVMERDSLRFQVLEKGKDHIAILRSHPLADRTYLSLPELGNTPLIIVGNEDSVVSGKLILNTCRDMGFAPNVRYSSSIETSMLWVQCGLGAAFLDSHNILKDYRSIRFLDTDQVSDPSLTAVWHQDNINPVLPIFIRELMRHRKKTVDSQ